MPYLIAVIAFAFGIILNHLFTQKQLYKSKLETADERSVNKRYIEEVTKLQAQIFELDDKYTRQLVANRELIRQKSSQATKSGNYVEVMAPLLEKFPVNILDKNVSLKHIGDPIDFIAFNFETAEIIIIEIKSGDAALSSRQKIVKRIVKEGRIRFIEFRMNSDGGLESKE
jgi:predicted Holliday junction resolvase-like endonuclease